LSALDAAIPVTFFTDYAAATKHEEAYTPRALAERIRTVTAPAKVRLPWLKLATFGERRSDKNSLRNDANVISITGIEADYDGGRVPVGDAVARIEQQGIATIIYTSPSHTEDAPRWRVLCPLSEPMAPDRRRQMLGRLNGLLGGIFSRESWTLSQGYYFGSVKHNPSHRVELIDGTTIDHHDDLDVIWIGPGNTEAAAMPDGPGDEREIAELVRRILTGEELHTTLCPLAARLIGRNVPPNATADILRGIMLAYPEQARDHRWRLRFGEIGRLVHSARVKYAEPAAERREHRRAIAALTGRMIRQRAPAAEIRAAVAAEAEQRGVPADDAEQIRLWIAERELQNRRAEHAGR
jgi:hypothetical protein